MGASIRLALSCGCCTATNVCQCYTWLFKSAHYVSLSIVCSQLEDTSESKVIISPLPCDSPMLRFSRSGSANLRSRSGACPSWVGSYQSIQLSLCGNADYLTKVVVAGKSSATLRVEEIMTPEGVLRTVTSTDTVLAAMELMIDNNFRHVPVVRNPLRCSHSIAMLRLSFWAVSEPSCFREQLHLAVGKQGT